MRRAAGPRRPGSAAGGGSSRPGWSWSSDWERLDPSDSDSVRGDHRHPDRRSKSSIGFRRFMMEADGGAEHLADESRDENRVTNRCHRHEHGSARSPRRDRVGRRRVAVGLGRAGAADFGRRRGRVRGSSVRANGLEVSAPAARIRHERTDFADPLGTGPGPEMAENARPGQRAVRLESTGSRCFHIIHFFVAEMTHSAGRFCPASEA